MAAAPVKISTKERAVKSVPFPPSHKLTVRELFQADGKINLARLKEHLTKEGRLEEEAAMKVIKTGMEVLRKEKTMLEISAPITGKWRFFVNGFNFINFIYFLTTIFSFEF